MIRDGSSGGVIRTAIITKDGVERETISAEQIPKFWGM
jgi:20S proteasome subunit beta 1